MSDLIKMLDTPQAACDTVSTVENPSKETEMKAHMYFINTNYLERVVHADADFAIMENCVRSTKTVQVTGPNKGAREYLASIGSKGGKASGKSKVRGDSDYYKRISQKAAAARKAKRATSSAKPSQGSKHAPVPASYRQRITGAEAMKGETRYSKKFKGNKGNYGWAVSFDVDGGYVGINQHAEDGMGRVLLTPSQMKALLRFLGATETVTGEQK